MKYTVRKSIVDLTGEIWQPGSGLCAQHKELSSYDVENCRDEDGAITRESVEQWLTRNSGDFRAIHDFRASIEDGPNTVEFDWEDFYDCMYPEE